MLDEVEYSIHGWQMAIRTIVGRTVADDTARLEYAWKIFVLNANRGVGLVVLQQYVVAWFVFFDEVIFE